MKKRFDRSGTARRKAAAAVAALTMALVLAVGGTGAATLLSAQPETLTVGAVVPHITAETPQASSPAAADPAPEAESTATAPEQEAESTAQLQQTAPAPEQTEKPETAEIAPAAPEEAAEKIRDFVYPIIVKPTDRSGSRAITRLESPEGLEAAVKAALAVLLGYLLLDDMGLMAGGIACIVGHCFPVFHQFRGGKGVSVGGLLSLMIDWRVGLLVFGSFGLFAVASKKVSLGSICGAFAITLGSLLFHVSTPRLILAIVSMCLVIFQHRGNIKRLLNGTEPDFRPKSSKKTENA